MASQTVTRATAQRFGSTRRHTAPEAKQCGSISRCNSHAVFAQQPVIGTGLSYGITTRVSRDLQGRNSMGISVGSRGKTTVLHASRCESWADLQRRLAPSGLMEEDSGRHIGTTFV